MTDELESRWTRGRVDPPAGLRQRVLAAVAEELKQPRPTSAPSSRAPFSRVPSGRGAWLTLTAALVVWVHLSWSAALSLRLPRKSLSTAAVTAQASLLRQLVPELSEADARRMVVVWSAGSATPPAPRW